MPGWKCCALVHSSLTHPPRCRLTRQVTWDAVKLLGQEGCEGGGGGGGRQPLDQLQVHTGGVVLGGLGSRRARNQRDCEWLPGVSRSHTNCEPWPQAAAPHLGWLRHRVCAPCKAQRQAVLLVLSIESKVELRGFAGRQAALSVALQVVQWILTISMRLPAQHAMPNKHSQASVFRTRPFPLTPPAHTA